MFIRRRLPSLSAILLIALTITGAPAQAANWRLDGAAPLNITGVSPHVERTSRGDLVFRSDGPAGTAVSLCSESGCTPVAFNSGGGPINDVTIVTFPNGTKRAYFVEITPNAGMKTVSSAPCLDVDCLSLGTRTPIGAGASAPMTQRAWGVPDAVLLPDGRVRVYLVESPVTGKCTENIASYISADGITFTKEAGWRLAGGFVDTEVLRTQAGGWLMILADIGCTSDRNQKLFTSESSDGLTWSKPAVLTGAGPSKLDPTGYEIAPNQYRIYYATANGNSFGPIERAVLSLGAPSSTSVTNTKITCKKGKKVKKVSAKKCPKGFVQVRSPR